VVGAGSSEGFLVARARTMQPMMQHRQLRRQILACLLVVEEPTGLALARTTVSKGPYHISPQLLEFGDRRTKHLLFCLPLVQSLSNVQFDYMIRSRVKDAHLG